jgi:FkbM family methyltransferase
MVMDHSSSLINYEVILELIENIKTLAKKRAIEEYIRSRSDVNNTLILGIKKVGGRFINPILKYFGFKLKIVKTEDNKYIVSNDEKSWSLDFLSYVLRKKPELDIRLFNEKDSYEVIKFVRNKICTALLTELRINDLFDEYDIKFKGIYETFIKKIEFKDGYFVLKHLNKEYRLPINHFEYSVFFHKLGISEIPSQCIIQIKGKDIIDGGAYIGDSALILEELSPRAIYAFEPLKENFVYLLKTIRINNLQNVVPLKMALGNIKGKISITSFGSASFKSEIFKEESKEEAEIIPIDEFVKEKGLDVGLIKLDVEGSELDVVLGATETIKKHKPVLIISLYHRGQDFFEIPKLIKQLEPLYRLRFLNLNKTSATFERILLAYIVDS